VELGYIQNNNKTSNLLNKGSTLFAIGGKIKEFQLIRLRSAARYCELHGHLDCSASVQWNIFFPPRVEFICPQTPKVCRCKLHPLQLFGTKDNLGILIPSVAENDHATT
jgi:hypothetical protein